MASAGGSQVALADSAGMLASALCVVHCVLTPVLLSMSTVLAHWLPGEELIHRTFVVVVASVGLVAIWGGYRRHRRGRVLGMMAAGLALLCVGAFVGDRLPAHWCEVLITLAGSGLMIAAHRVNHTFCQECGRCGVKGC